MNFNMVLTLPEAHQAPSWSQLLYSRLSVQNSHLYLDSTKHTSNAADTFLCLSNCMETLVLFLLLFLLLLLLFFIQFISFHFISFHVCCMFCMCCICCICCVCCVCCVFASWCVLCTSRHVFLPWLFFLLCYLSPCDCLLIDLCFCCFVQIL